jgi:hypothetical protein
MSNLIFSALETYGITEDEWAKMGHGAPWEESGPSETQLLLMASLAYVDAASVESYGWQNFGFPSSAQPVCRFLHETGFHCYAITVGHNLILSFRGTRLPGLKYDSSDPFNLMEFTRDWMANFQFDQVIGPPGSEGYVHDGFYQAVSSLFPLFLPVVTRFERMQPKGRVLLTGHSQGAALAIIATSMLLTNFSNNDLFLYMCVFAPPLVGDESFIHWMNKVATNQSNIHLLRYTNAADPIPLIPFSSPLGSYFPGPGGHVHLSVGNNRRVFRTGGMDDYFEEHLPKICFKTLLEFIVFLVTAPFDLLAHFPAGPELSLPSSSSHLPNRRRSGYLASLSDSPPPYTDLC